MSEIQLIKTLILVFGCMFAYRTTFFLRSKLKFSKFLFIFIQLILILSLLVLFLNLNTSLFAITTPIVILFCDAVTIFVTRMTIERKLRTEFLHFLDQITLKMKMGHSFFEAAESALLKRKSKNSKYFCKICQLALKNETFKPKSEIEKQIFNELSSWIHIPIKLLSRIQNLRAILRSEEEFRHKSEQIIHQIQIQVVMITIMYVLMSFFIIQKFPLIKYWGVYLSSICLFLVGLVTFYLIARRRIWKI